MPLIVQKFGGTSMGSIDRIRNVAQKALLEVKNGNKIIIVASAMSGETNRLVSLFSEACTGEAANSQEALAEYDAITSSGEQVSCALLAAVFIESGIKARSLSGWQIGFETDDFHSKSRIANIKTDVLNDLLHKGIIPIVAGFQGVNPRTKRITTLGRGGSDTSAIAIAAAMKADRCDIYTDVDGIYTSDPRIVKNAKKLDSVSYEEVLEMASSGAKVLEPRSVVLAMQYNVQTQVLSSFTGAKGTILTNENSMEQKLITGVTSSNNDVEFTLKNMQEGAKITSTLFKLLTDSNIIVDMIAQSTSGDQKISITFTIAKIDMELAKQILEKNKNILQYEDILINKDVVKISVIGVGMKSNAGIAHKMFETLANKGINHIFAITTSEIKISILIDAEYHELAMRSLHDAFC